MWEKSKIVNLSWLLFATLMIGRNRLAQKNTHTLKLESLNEFYFVNCLFVGFSILCVKMKTLLCEENVLHHGKKSCFPS